MADQTTNEAPSRPKASELLAEAQREIATLRGQLEAIAAEKARAEELAAARLAEREKAIATGEPPKLIGQLNVYLQDSSQDILDRVRPMFEGRVPLDRATKFKIDGKLTVPSRYAEGQKPWPIGKRLGLSPKVGEVFDRDEMPAEEIAHYAAQGVIVAVA